MRLKYFTPDEFTRCNPRCCIGQMNQEFLEKLDKARELAGVPFVLNSCFRSKSHDLERGRSGVGYHTLGRAADLRCIDSKTRWKIVRACTSLGLACGVAPTFIHVDDRPTPILFLY